MGVIGHVARAVFNVLPDRLSDNKTMDMVISDGYDASDRLFGTEYDDAGYYMLDSRRNLTIAVLSTLAAGWGAMLLHTELALMVANGVNWAGGWLWQLFLYRISHARWW